MARHPRRRSTLLLILSAVLVLAACSRRGDPADPAVTLTASSPTASNPLPTNGTRTPASTETLATTTGSNPAQQTLAIIDTVLYEHMEGEFGSVPSFSWGVRINNPTAQTATGVELVVSLKAKDRVVRTDYHSIDEIQPGAFSWGSRPIQIRDNSGSVVHLDAVEIAVSESGWEKSSKRDRLVSPGIFSLTEPYPYELMLTIDAIDDPRQLWAVFTFVDARGNLIAVDPVGVDERQLRPGEPVTVESLILRYEGAREARVSIVRVSQDPSDFRSDPPRP